MASAFSSHIYAVHNEEERKIDCARFRKAVEQLDEFFRMQKKEEARIDGIASGMDRHDSDIYLNLKREFRKTEVKTLKHIRYFKNLLTTNYCTQVE